MTMDQVVDAYGLCVPPSSFLIYDRAGKTFIQNYLSNYQCLTALVSLHLTKQWG